MRLVNVSSSFLTGASFQVHDDSCFVRLLGLQWVVICIKNSYKMASKINQILLEWLPHDVHSAHWLAERGVRRGLLQFHLKNGVLERIAPGIYKRAGEVADWAGVVRLLQEELARNVHVSGRTALELVGRSHFSNMSNRPSIFLATYSPKKLPVWLKQIGNTGEFVIRNSSLFREEFFLENRERFLVKHEKMPNLKVKISCCELAILELIDIGDLANSLETVENHVNMLYGGRSVVIQSLLENCKSIKVKRVFLYLSEKSGNRYFKHLDLSKIELGRGKRQIVKHNARLDKKYLITVDKGYDGDFL